MFKSQQLRVSLHKSCSLTMQETQEVYVAAYKSDEFPAFFTEKSGCKVEHCQNFHYTELSRLLLLGYLVLMWIY